LDRGWIQYSISLTRVPILFVSKKDRKLYLYIDYQVLNMVIKKNWYTLLLTSEIPDRLNRAQYLTKINLQNAYHQIAITKGDRWKITFHICYGYFKYYIMPFGLTNSLTIFQTYINKAFNGLVDIICVVYFNNILIYSKNLE
jgi:hypothetical protein